MLSPFIVSPVLSSPVNPRREDRKEQNTAFLKNQKILCHSTHRHTPLHSPSLSTDKEREHVHGRLESTSQNHGFLRFLSLLTPPSTTLYSLSIGVQNVVPTESVTPLHVPSILRGETVEIGKGIITQKQIQLYWPSRFDLFPELEIQEASPWPMIYSSVNSSNREAGVRIFRRSVIFILEKRYVSYHIDSAVRSTSNSDNWNIRSLMF